MLLCVICIYVHVPVGTDTFISLYVIVRWEILVSFLRNLLPSNFEAESLTILDWTHQVDQAGWPRSSSNPLAHSSPALGLETMPHQFWESNSCLYSWKTNILLTGSSPCLPLCLTYGGLYHKAHPKSSYQNGVYICSI